MNFEDMKKIECPFVRKVMPNGDYIVTDEIMEGFEWVFTDDKVMAIEKLHGTNVSIIIQEGSVIAMFNRTERIPFINKNKDWITQGVLNSYKNGYMEKLGDGQHFGELIGEKVNGNPYQIQGHLWIPFETFAQDHLKYKSWGKYPKDFQTISNWFKNDLMPLYWAMKQGMTKDKEGNYIGFVEGIVFTHPDGRMSKIRKDMFDWFKGKRHKEDNIQLNSKEKKNEKQN